jgi:hypothetical protein
MLYTIGVYATGISIFLAIIAMVCFGVMEL